MIHDYKLYQLIGIEMQSKDLDGTAGEIESWQDFIVRELPLYEPCGEGEHQYYELKKKNNTTFSVLQKISKRCGVHPRDIGYAGLKDKFGITFQTISLPVKQSTSAFKVGDDDFRLRFLGNHQNKIKIGHLKGNAFEIRIRGCKPGFENLLKSKVDFINNHPIGNFYGPQRFGNMMNNHLIGLEVIKGNFKKAIELMLAESDLEKNKQMAESRRLFSEGNTSKAYENSPLFYVNEKNVLKELCKGEDRHKRAYLKIDKKQRELYFNAAQSFIFNEFVKTRINKTELVEGDVCLVARNLAPFIVENPKVEMERLANGEIFLSGPLFGKKMITAKGNGGLVEKSLLEKHGLNFEMFQAPEDKMKFLGARRPINIKIGDLKINEIHEDGFTISFQLNPGCYASVLLNEILNPV